MMFNDFYVTAGENGLYFYAGLDRNFLYGKVNHLNLLFIDFNWNS